MVCRLFQVEVSGNGYEAIVAYSFGTLYCIE